ncbi:MAG: hypothetical protein WEB30_13145 [Cyclobacteriaceae bacterium]
MKKLLLTGITTALFSIAAIAQEKDTTQNESSQYRQSEEMQQDPAERAADSVSTDFQEGVNETEQEIDQAEDNLQQESNELRQDAEETGEDIEEGAERAGEDIDQAAEETGEDIEQGAERTGDEIEQSTDQAVDKTEQAADGTLNEMNKDLESSVEGKNQQGSADHKTASELEVVENKEGPNNEVVYKYQDEYFYIDRDKKTVVKAKESELEDAGHKVVVKEGKKSSDDNTSSGNREDSDGATDENNADASSAEDQNDAPGTQDQK